MPSSRRKQRTFVLNSTLIVFVEYSFSHVHLPYNKFHVSLKGCSQIIEIGTFINGWRFVVGSKMSYLYQVTWPYYTLKPDTHSNRDTGSKLYVVWSRSATVVGTPDEIGKWAICYSCDHGYLLEGGNVLLFQKLGVIQHHHQLVMSPLWTPNMSTCSTRGICCQLNTLMTEFWHSRPLYITDTKVPIVLSRLSATKLTSLSCLSTEQRGALTYMVVSSSEDVGHSAKTRARIHPEHIEYWWLRWLFDASRMDGCFSCGTHNSLRDYCTHRRHKHHTYYDSWTALLYWLLYEQPSINPCQLDYSSYGYGTHNRYIYHNSRTVSTSS